MGLDVEATAVAQIGAVLGEGPVWIRRDSTLRFVDIKERRIYRFDPATGDLSFKTAPDQPGFVLPVKGGGFVAGLQSGVHRFDDNTGAFTKISDVEAHLPGNRLNDGAVGPDHALWFGSMNDAETGTTGSLFRMDAGGRVTSLDSNYGITNGPAFSPDGRAFYHTDSAACVTYVFDAATDGTLSNKRPFIRFDSGTGWPDGSVVDAEGCIWISMWGGWGVRRYSPLGELLNTIPFPCANVTKIAFGGSDLRTAYATTASKGLSADERAAQPLAGDLFSFRTDVPGLESLELILE